MYQIIKLEKQKNNNDIYKHIIDELPNNFFDSEDDTTQLNTNRFIYLNLSLFYFV